MQSKWLSWQPGSVGSVGAPQGKDPIIESSGTAESGVSCSYGCVEPPIIENTGRDVPTKPTELRPTDSDYRELICRAMKQIEEACPPGALRWARGAHPTLTDEIDVQLLAQLNDLWSKHAPLPQFQAALDQLVRLHREVGKLYASE